MAAPLRLLFICAMNRRRSATAEQIYRDDPRVTVRSAGLRADARQKLAPADLAWAEVVFVMENEHRTTLRQRFAGSDLPPIEVLDIADDYEYMDPELQEILRLTVDPQIDARLPARDPS